MASTADEPTVAATEAQKQKEEESATVAEDEDTGAQVAPIVKLQEVAVTTGEENEDALLDLYEYIHPFLHFFPVFVVRFGFF